MHIRIGYHSTQSFASTIVKVIFSKFKSEIESLGPLLGPFRMKNTFSVDTTIGMAAKIIPLGLNQIGW